MYARLQDFFDAHWQGRLALVPTLLLTLLGLRLALGWASRLRPPDWPLAAFVLLTGLSLAVLVWQIIGSLRAIRRDGSGLALTAGLAAIAGAVALFVTAELDGYASRAADNAGLPPIVPLPVDANGVLHVSGDLDWPLYGRFCTSLSRFPEVREVSLASEGGYVPVGRAMAARIMEAGLDTTATGLCASACTLAFMAGTNRGLGPDGALGFHGYALHGYAPFQDPRAEEARDRAWLIARGVDPSFIAHAYATDHDSLWRPDRATLRAAGLLADGAIALPPWPGTRSPDCGPLPDQATSP